MELEKLNTHVILDLAEQTENVIVSANRGDQHSRNILFSFVFDGEEYPIPSGVTAEIRGTRPDGLGIWEECKVEGNGVLYTMTPYVLNVSGDVRAKVVLINKNSDPEQILSSIGFTIHIPVDPFDENSILKTDEYSVLQNLVKQVEIAVDKAEEAREMAEELNEKVNAAEEIRETAETDRKESEIARENAEYQREENEELRIASEDIREDNEIARIEAEDIRKENEEARIDAEEIRKANEEDRQENEVLRKEAETDRKESEAARQENELERIDAEIQRQEDEGIRVDNEANRVADEIERKESEEERKTNESVRIENELLRQSQEDLRQTTHEEALTTLNEMQSRIENFDAVVDDSGLVYASIEEDTEEIPSVYPEDIYDLIESKVSKENGMGLSQNSYTDEDKESLSNVVTVIKTINDNNVALRETVNALMERVVELESQVAKLSGTI